MERAPESLPVYVPFQFLLNITIRATFWLRSVHPDLTEAFALQHDSNVWTCLDTILGSPSDSGMAKVLASLGFSLGGFGLSSAHRNRERCPLAQLGRLFAHGARPTPGDNDHTVVSRVSRGVADWWRMQGLRFLLGGNWQRHQQRVWRTPNRASPSMGGNRR